MDLKFSKVTRKGPITIVTLSRPEVYNALHIDAHFELNKIFDDFSADPEQWVAAHRSGATGDLTALNAVFAKVVSEARESE